MRVMWQPPPHKSFTGPGHPSGHRCGTCTEFYEPRPVRLAWRPGLRWARKAAEAMNYLSMTPGWFYAEADGGNDDLRYPPPDSAPESCRPVDPPSTPHHPNYPVDQP